MEELRRKLAQDPNLYPDVSRPKDMIKPSRPVRTPSEAQNVISISSDISEVAPPSQGKPRQQVVVLSDSESETVSQPLRPKVPASQRPAMPPAKPNPSIKAVPIHVPSNRDIQNAAVRPVQPNYETFDMSGLDNDYDPRLSDADAEKALRDLVTDVYAHGAHEVSTEDAIVEGFREGIKLLPHQVVSRRWMADRESGKKTGGILADDMGLGKTIQTITRIIDGRPSRKEKKSEFSATTLVICPVAVVSQWASEIKKIAIGLRVIEHHGQSRTSDPTEIERAHVVITSYSTVASEFGAYNPAASDESKTSKTKPKKSQNSSGDESDDGTLGHTLVNAKRKAPKKKPKNALFRVKWWRIVLDEAHNIKNRKTKTAEACCALESKYRWCLTGTPMQNNVEELYSLFKFLRVRPLNDWTTFNTQIAQPIGAKRPTRAIKRLQVVLRSVMLRRTKDTLVNGKPILELPERIVKTVDCEFDEEERAFYDTVQVRVHARLEALQKQGGVANNYTSMLVLLLRLRQACNHPSLVSEDYKKDREAVEPKGAKDNDDDDEDTDDLVDRLAGMGLNSLKRCQLCQTELGSANGSKDTCDACVALVTKSRRKTVDANSDLPPDSAKTRKILEILQEIDGRSEGGEKTIIFSQFTSMLDIIEPFLKAEGIRYVRYDGSMNKGQREDALTTIKESRKTRVILISFKAGSTGLNLTCCNNVILVDLWWNPALEDQAFDRAHRFGQTRAVHIHKLCIPNTVEQRILEVSFPTMFVSMPAESLPWSASGKKEGFSQCSPLWGQSKEHASWCRRVGCSLQTRGS
ncbi:hypothetical protein AcV5_009827 [Taiwanofungus camphoratus]|nr:hypothetical protein AcV5_009827 [Antrodia cinnamomea]KAI0926509.1 hypothetical protein AcV7_005426 [Antrodia cinnamomea]